MQASFQLFSQQIQIGHDTIESRSIPYSTFQAYSFSQSIYPKEFVHASGTINKLSFYYNGGTAGTENIKIYLGQTEMEKFTTENNGYRIPQNHMTKVYDGIISLPAVKAWVEIILTTPFIYDGSNNLVIDITKSKNHDESSITKDAFLCTNLNDEYLTTANNSNFDLTQDQYGKLIKYVPNVIINGTLVSSSHFFVENPHQPISTDFYSKCIFNVLSNGTDFSAISNANWLDLSVDIINKKIKATVNTLDNTIIEDRTATIIVSAPGYLNDTISLTQYLYEPIDKLTFPGVTNPINYEYIQGSINIIDYDNDNDYDFFIIGDCRTTDHHEKQKYLIRNNHNAFDTVNTTTLENFSSADWNDFNNDGLVDLTGAGGYYQSYFNIYSNTGNNIFTEIKNIIPKLTESSVSWGDYDTDGDLDLLLTGKNSEGLGMTKIYRNEGNNVFIETKIGLRDCSNGGATWGDFNNDGRLDILLRGIDSNSNGFYAVYQNMGNDQFNVFTMNSANEIYDKVLWVDLDNDKDLDLIVFTFNYFNNSSFYVYNFDEGKYLLKYSKNTNINIYTLKNLKGIDIDNNGFSDVLLFVEITNGINDGLDYMYYLKNDGINLRIDSLKLYTSPIKDVNKSFGQGSSVGQVCDIDNDGDLDLILSMGQIDGRYLDVTKIIRNNCKIKNSPPSIPQNLQSEVINGSLQLKWNASFDNQTSSLGLSYNIRVGTNSNGIDVITPSSDLNSGFHKILTIGNTGYDTIYTFNGIPNYTMLYWSVQAIDNGGIASAFSHESVINTPKLFDLITTSSFPQITEGSVEWGDFDNDNDLDLLLGGNTYPDSFETSVYVNLGTDQFKQVDLNLPRSDYGLCNLKWIDYNNDNHLDMVYLSRRLYPLSDTLYIIKNNNNNTFTTVFKTALNSNGDLNLQIFDFNNDGYNEVLFFDDISRPFLLQYKGNDLFETKSINKKISAPQGCSDFDNDFSYELIYKGDKQTIKSYSFNEDQDKTIFSYNYESMLDIWGTNNFTSTSIGDYNKDQYMDFITIGNIRNYGLSTLIFKNTKSNGMNDSIISIRNLGQYTRFSLIDFNNDSNLDVLSTALLGGPNSFSYLYNYFRGNYLLDFILDPDIYLFAWGDYNDDGNIDLFATNTRGGGLYKNMGNFSTEKASPPTNLKTEASGYGSIFHWDESTYLGAKGGLTYNIRVGKTPYGTEIISPASDVITGYRRLSQMGNCQLNLGWKLDSVPQGTYYWSVQAISPNNMGGEWATEQSFTVTNVRTNFIADTVCLGNSTSFTDNTLLAGGTATGYKWYFGDGATDTVQNPSHKYLIADTFTVSLVVNSGAFSDSISKTIIVKPKPSASFSIAPVCLGSPSVLLNNSNENLLNISKYQWSFGDGQTSNLKNPLEHAYAYTGTYISKLKLAASNGCSDSISQNAVVGAYPNASISSTGVSTICKGDTFVLVVPFNSNYAYQWKNNELAVTNADSSKLVIKQYSGNYKVDVINTIAGCKSTSDVVTVTVNEAPSSPFITTTGATTFCQGDSVKLSVGAQVGAGYLWKLNGGGIGSNTNVIYAKTSGNYTISLSNSSNCSAQSANTISVTVNEKPVLLSVSYGETQFCRGGSVSFSVPQNSENSYQWKNGFAEISGSKSNQLTVSETGEYSLEITNSNYCTVSTSKVKVIVDEIPAKPAISETNNNTLFCLGTEIELKITNPSTNLSYQWKRSGINIEGANLENFKGKLVAGDYQLDVRIGNCTAESEVLTLTTKPTPAKPNIYARGPNVWVLACDNTIAKDYRWYFNDQLISGAKTNQYIASQKLGNYRVEINDGGECYATSDIINIPTGNIVNGLNDLTSESVSIFPNPTPNGVFTVSLGKLLPGELTVAIADALGSEISIQKLHDSSGFPIDLSSEPDGIYFCKIFYKNYFIVIKVVKN